MEDFVDALGRKPLAMRSAMTLLAAALALLLPIRLGFVRRDLARANAARDRTRAIARRRKMRVARVAVQTFGEFQDQLLEFGDPEVSFSQLPIVLRVDPIGNSDDRPGPCGGSSPCTATSTFDHIVSAVSIPRPVWLIASATKGG